MAGANGGGGADRLYKIRVIVGKECYRQSKRRTYG